MEPMEAIPAPITAQASLKPCQLHKYHWPRPTRTQGHHRHPIYLQNRVYGKIQDAALLFLCGTCHDSVHDWLSFLLGESRKPDPEPGRRAKAEAHYAYDWYKSYQA